MNLKSLLKELTDCVGIGHLNAIRETVKGYLSPYAAVEETGNLGLIGKIDLGKEKTILLDAHIDEVGMVVTNVSENGFLTVNNCGGIDLRTLPAREVTVHGKEDISGVFISTPPHLSKGDEKFKDINKILIDVGEENAKKVSVGDFVTYKNNFVCLGDTRISAKALDNRAGCAVLLALAEKLSGKALPCNIIFLFSDGEELGLRGARTSVYAHSPSEAIVIDVSFGNAPDVPSSKCGKLGKGAMIGISPVLDRNITRTLENIAKEENLPYQSEVMGSSTGTNADVITVSKSGIKTGLVSIPLRNMHTDCEIVDIKDVETTVSLLEKYIMAGGINND
jgi:endoglucanase